jgi:hypothetical protein
MSKDEVDCEDPENADHPDCQCDFDDGDRQYDAWADERVIQFYERMELLFHQPTHHIPYLHRQNHIDNLGDLRSLDLHNLLRLYSFRFLIGNSAQNFL